jgi:hypothetical protein
MTPTYPSSWGKSGHQHWKEVVDYQNAMLKIRWEKNKNVYYPTVPVTPPSRSLAIRRCLIITTVCSLASTAFLLGGIFSPHCNNNSDDQVNNSSSSQKSCCVVTCYAIAAGIALSTIIWSAVACRFIPALPNPEKSKLINSTTKV